MAKTVLTSATSYASATDLLNCHNAAQIGQWCNDAGVTLTPGAIINDSVVAAALLRASGEIEMSCVRGGRYTPADLAALTGASQAALKGIVCDLAYYFLARRRLESKNAEEIAGYEAIQKKLEDLNTGELIFGFVETTQASNMSTIDTANDSRKLLNRPTEMASRFFGQRMDSGSGNPINGAV